MFAAAPALAEEQVVEPVAAETWGATFAPLDQPDQPYRTRLWRVWGDPANVVIWVMLNPSIADASINDPTVARCVDFAGRWGCGAHEVVNIFSWRSTDKSVLPGVRDAIGPGNDAAILRAAMRARRVVLAYGNDGKLYGRGNAVAEMLTRAQAKYGFELLAMRITKMGFPEHPLYLPKVLVPAPYRFTYPPRECSPRPHGFVHLWTRHKSPGDLEMARENIMSCRICGSVRPTDPAQRRGCVGRVRVGLREDTTRVA